MKRATLELTLLKPKTAQYLAMRSIEEQKSVFDLLVELADKRADYEVSDRFQNRRPDDRNEQEAEKVLKETLNKKDR